MSTSSIRVNTLFEWCNDISATRAFYTDLLGLTETNYRDDEKIGWLSYQLGDVQLVFTRSSGLPVLDDWAKTLFFSDGTIEAPMLLLRIAKEDFAPLVARLQASDVPIYEGDVDTSRVIFVRDPMGKTIEIDIDVEE